MVQVVHFPKRCQHGTELQFVGKFSGSGYWYARDCGPCLDEKERRQEEEIRACLEARGFDQ